MATIIDRRLDVIVDAPAPGEENMRRDVSLLEACAHGEIPGAIRLYGFRPACLSLGRMQPMTDVDLEACRRDGVDVVRRPSGGRAVLHDEEVTYSVVCRSRDPVFGGRVLESCARIHDAIAVGLGVLGVQTTPRAMPETSGVTHARARRSRTASPGRLRMSCSTIEAESSSAARRRGARAPFSSTARCCWNRRGQDATSGAMPHRSSVASVFGSCSAVRSAARNSSTRSPKGSAARLRRLRHPVPPQSPDLHHGRRLRTS